MKKIISVIGARPQFIKHAPMQIQLQKHFNALTIHTGQHYDPGMSDVFFNELKIPAPDYRFHLNGKLHGQQTAEMMTEIEQIAVKEKPDGLLVYGDTNSTLAGALVASKLHIPIIHIEAGLRSFNREMPEEVNRVLTDHISELLFCPSNAAVENLKAEGIERNVHLCGDVMKDMLSLASGYLGDKMEGKPYYFATIHRPYNTDVTERMLVILESLNALNAPVVFAIHPRTVSRLSDYKVDLAAYKNIIAIPPVGYFDSLSYQAYSLGVITDSGGVQKEAYWLKKRCITIRKETEWLETLTGNWNQLVFDDVASIREKLDMSLSDYNEELYGTVDNSATIVSLLNDKFYK
ncbi:UDP-N-acetylglucosamine 2-epimerase (non-hydrolyzing) [Chitinophaga sp. G-6-1-13]|uniref:UDP-N-acetylglucosamine 2-epimerase (Non-hydrolyzing) n=1 Tax=Chitinophaga fulva TaxID=2728842 RepID=A0A848GFS0_9BACT|nr:UDP-N-acetylglucosamine 2-epimerase (non-hydrolyzing) [Chitinophaga fulva]NML35833.1 UDP-N-acetylglucosamine 2-epimerase (non-hydrolyzing) [Chitinophaga fulva]